MKGLLSALVIILLLISCKSEKKQEGKSVDISFSEFENRFLDAYWKQYPSSSIYIGYGKYYEDLIIPDSTAVANSIAFSKHWIDSLNGLDYEKLNDNNKISLKIIKNQLESDIWYKESLKIQEWDPSIYNISGECSYLLSQAGVNLDDKLRTLSKHIKNADLYYSTAFKMLKQPTKEHTNYAIVQNGGGLSVFGKDLTDSIAVSHLTTEEKAELTERVTKTLTAISNYIKSLKGILADKNYTFKSFRIGKELYAVKFKYDIAADFSPEDIYKKCVDDKKKYYEHMYTVAGKLWSKYYTNQTAPKDTLKLIQAIITKISLQHAKPEHFFDTLSNHVTRLKHFIIAKDLFDFDTTYPVKVRLMPAYARGFSVASADLALPYQKQGETYYNIDDLTSYQKDRAEGVLREYNNYASQLLSIHEAIPGHCLQGIYNNKKSADKLRAVFQNGAMIEGWAVYAENLMLENGWGEGSLEMDLIFDKLKLRELANVIIDYDLQCLNKQKEAIMHLLVNECFQTEAQAEEKYNRATLSQVQLCSYYSGFTAIQSLREEYKRKMGVKYSVKDFHEKFLSYGSSPVKYIREMMLK